MRTVSPVRLSRKVVVQDSDANLFSRRFVIEFWIPNRMALQNIFHLKIRVQKYPSGWQFKRAGINGYVKFSFNIPERGFLFQKIARYTRKGLIYISER